MGVDHQPLGGLVSPQIGERPQHGEGHIEVVDQDVAPLDGGLRSRDEDDPPIGRIVDQPLAERAEIVVGDAEDVVAFARRAVDEGRGVVGDAGLTLAGVQMEVDLQPAGHSTVTLRSEEHTSELQSLAYLVCRLLLEKKKTDIHYYLLEDHS